MEFQLDVLARDKRGDSFLGTNSIDFSGFTQQTKDLWIPLEDKNKKPSGEIHIQVRYDVSDKSKT